MRHAVLTRLLPALLLAAAAAALAGAQAAPPTNSPLEDSLLHAADRGDVRAMGDLLAKGARIDAVDTLDGATALLKAVGNGDSTAVRFLVERGAGLEMVNAIGYTPLSFATGLEYTSLAKLLVDKGADINSTACGVPALCHAANTNNAELADYFLAKGANPDLADRDGNTPLMWASFQGAAAVVRSLLAHGADPNVMGPGFGSAGRTALDAAIERDQAEVIAVLKAAGAAATLAVPDPEKDARSQRLILAADAGDLETMKTLISQGVDIDAVSPPDGRSALLNAANQGHDEGVRLLLDNGAAIELAESQGVTPLIMAATLRHVSTVKLLLERGADINGAMNQGLTALTAAASVDNLEVVEALLAAGADTERRGDQGMTALMYAAAQDFQDVVKALIRHGANVNAVSDVNQTALMWAAASGYIEVAKELLKAGADPNIAMIDPAIEATNPDFGETDPDSDESDLDAAAPAGGADAPAAAGQTAMSLAEAYGQGDMVKLLKKAGARR